MSDFDTALARYLHAVRTAGAPDGEAIASPADVERVVDGVAPYIIPPDLQRGWMRLSYWDWLIDNGDLQSPTLSLEMWDRSVQDFGQPRLLFPVSYASHTYLYIELGVVGGPPGGALLLAPIAEPLVRHAPSLGWALEFITGRVEGGAARWNGWWTSRVSEEEVQSAAAGRPWPQYLRHTIDPSQSLTWPAHWQRAQGINPADATLRGADTEIAALLALRPGATCRIQGRIVALASAAAGARIGVADESGEAVVWVPQSADPFGAVRIRDQVELDVTVGQPRDEPSAEIFAQIAALPIPPDDETARRMAANAAAMFDAASYRFRATMARPVEP
jgi:hypothetical protein